MARGSTDDLVVAPRFGAGPVVPSKPVDARIQQQAQRRTGAHRGQGLLGSFARARILRRAASIAAPRLLGAQASSAFGSLSRLGLVGGTLAAIGIAAVKVGSEKTFEQLAEEFNNELFGTADDDARARRTVREAIAGDPFLAKVAYKKGSGELSSLFDGLVQSETQRERSRSQIMLDKGFEVKGPLDMLFDSVTNVVVETWQARQAEWEEFKAAIHRRSSRSPKWGVR